MLILSIQVQISEEGIIKMRKVTIFVEGVNDELFLRQLIKKLYNKELNKHGEIGGIIILGEHNAQYKQAETFEKSSLMGFQNLVFEDADLIKNGRGFDKVCQLLENQNTDYSLNFDYFLFPNHEKEGTLEDLLQEILREPKSEWLNCAKNYYECLAKNGKVYNKKIQWDIFTSSVIKDKKLNFADETTWFIDENPYLKPLIDFLNKFFQ